MEGCDLHGTNLVVTEKPSVAQSIAAVLGANKRGDGYLEGGDWLISWCFSHLVEARWT
jgi:DNA topoisomerase-3